MSRPGFIEGVGVALAASAAAGVAFGALAGVLPAYLAIRGVVSLVALGYVVYLLARTPRRVGRPSALLAWLLATGVLLAIDPPLVFHVLAQVGVVWLVRTLHYHRSALAALADLGLGVLSLAGAIWCLGETGSIALSVWCLLLVQALFVAIPQGLPRVRLQRAAGGDESFERAHRSAESALRRLVPIH